MCDCKLVKLVNFAKVEIIIWKVQGVPQYYNAAYHKHQEKEESPPYRNHIITSKR